MWGEKAGTSLQSSATTNKWIDGFFVCLSIILDEVTPLECWKIVFYFRGRHWCLFLFLRSYKNHYWLLKWHKTRYLSFKWRSIQISFIVKLKGLVQVVSHYISILHSDDLIFLYFRFYFIDYGITFLALPTSMKASTVLSMSSVVWAAEICTRILAFPLATTG